MKVATVKVNKDLQDERDKIDFDIEEFTNWFYKGADKVEEKRFLGIFTITWHTSVIILIFFLNFRKLFLIGS